MFGRFTFGSRPFGAAPASSSGTAPASTVTGITATPTTLALAGGATQTVAIAVQGLNNPGQGFTSVKLSGVGSVSGGDVTAPAATSVQQTGTFRFRSAQDPSFYVDVVLTVAATAPADGGGAAFATHIFEQFESRLGVPQANLVGMHWYVFAAVGAAAFGAPIAQGVFETTDAAGYILLDITGQTAVLPGAPVTLFYTNANGDPDQLDLITWGGTVRAL
jgi:hypothetical protein